MQDSSRDRSFISFYGLADAVLADCADGSLMSLSLHTTGSDAAESTLRGWISLVYNDEEGQEQYLYIDLNENCRYTLYWISTHGTPRAAR